MTVRVDGHPADDRVRDAGRGKGIGHAAHRLVNRVGPLEEHADLRQPAVEVARPPRRGRSAKGGPVCRHRRGFYRPHPPTRGPPPLYPPARPRMMRPPPPPQGGPWEARPPPHPRAPATLYPPARPRMMRQPPHRQGDPWTRRHRQTPPNPSNFTGCG